MICARGGQRIVAIGLQDLDGINIARLLDGVAMISFGPKTPRQLIEPVKQQRRHMDSQSKEHSPEETTIPTAGTAKKADDAVRETAQSYVDRTGLKLDLRQVEKIIHDKPLHSAAIAAAIGFIFGGGIATRPGWAILALFGRKAARHTATNFVTGMKRTASR
jgi:ElaB/YqjD/DUF883 family membrane-anchored ribosome-binding protein